MSISSEASPVKPATPSHWTFRQCLCLCIPALIIGALLRIYFLYAIPEAFYGSDSASYFQAASKLWNTHHLDLDAKRRWLYPLLMLPLPALPVSPARIIPIVQHLIGLASIAGIGWIVGNLTRLRALWVPLVTTMAAISPAFLWREHEIVADSIFLGAFVLTVALAMPVASLLNPRRLFWFLCAAALIATLKPSGRGLWLGCVLTAILATGNPMKWKIKCWIPVAVAVAAILTSGEPRQSRWLLLTSTLPFVNLEGTTWHEYREALRPMVVQARKDGNQYPWTQREYKKPLGDGDPVTVDPVWASLTRREKEYLKVCGDLGREALLSRPLTWLRFTITKMGIAFSGYEVMLHELDPQSFWRFELHETQDQWEDASSRLKLLYRMDYDGFKQLAVERQGCHNPTLPFVLALPAHLPWLHENEDPLNINNSLTPGFLIMLAIFGLVVCLMPGRFTATAVIWLPVMLYLFTVFGVADRVPQYTEPVEWALVVLTAIGLDVLLTAGYSRLRQKT